MFPDPFQTPNRLTHRDAWEARRNRPIDLQRLTKSAQAPSNRPAYLIKRHSTDPFRSPTHPFRRLPTHSHRPIQTLADPFKRSPTRSDAPDPFRRAPIRSDARRPAQTLTDPLRRSPTRSDARPPVKTPPTHSETPPILSDALQRLSSQLINFQTNKAKQSRENNALMQEQLEWKDGSVIWHRVKYEPHNLYPNIPWVNDKPTRIPTAAEIASAHKQVRSYRFLTSGLNVIKDPLDKKSVIAIVEFTPVEELTSSQIKDLNYVSNFLHKSKRFINGVHSCSRVWGGLMWAIGWRKSYDEDQIVGRYIKAFNETEMRAFDEHYVKSSKVGQIIGNLFKDLAHTPFQDNQDLMKKYNIPSFPDLAYGELPQESTCTPHITFTTNGFFNPPHKDTEDISQFAFVLFLPTCTSDYNLVDSSNMGLSR
ncbi:hypothetical protein PtA15_10A524 [Puccinia triticina]|uniref:Tet-like 2OG-Fe(II) oxygenase domain-containing protein n=1 Tax=Puccinia triticina TaxID=208348 RepID=A0ABY7CWS1_9BASI|nr:uncharacterized protein PtA15_10A524 [Puccinia triticina]WAQ89100.1 hypothetical protein PtA15_10A524 [Puccinia triticina]